MKRFGIGRPSPALVISVIALFVALGGVGYAAATIGSAQIKNNSVRSKDVRNSNLLGKDLKRNTIGGSRILESSMAKVPSAGKADTATSATSAATAANATNAANAAKVGGLTVLKQTASVDLPDFLAGQNQCKSVLVAVPGVLPGDAVAMNDADNSTPTGVDQMSLNVAGVQAGVVRINACLSADAAPPFSPGPQPYVFLMVR